MRVLVLMSAISEFSKYCTMEHISKIEVKTMSRLFRTSAVLSLCERFNLACPDGYYGDTCTDVCGSCVGGEACYKLSGICPNGCAAGWSGVMCTTGRLFNVVILLLCHALYVHVCDLIYVKYCFVL